MLKGMCGCGVDVPLTENDYCFDKNGKIMIDERFEENLMQTDNKDERKERVGLPLTSMAGSRK
jgi:hypothetical protein